MFATSRNRNSRASASELKTKSKNFDGTTICMSGQTAWSLLALAGAGTVVVISISSGIWGKGISFLKELVKVCHQKIDEGGTINDETSDAGMKEDRISELPNDLLYDILSRLSLIDAARTRILSRRWKNICPHRLIFDCLNTLIYYDGYPLNKKHRSAQKRVKCLFFKAVDQSLKLYLGQKITSVKIRCCFGKECYSYLGQWIHSCAGLGIEELCLEFECPGIIEYPDGRHWFDDLDLAFSFQLLFEVVSLKRLYLSRCVLQPSFNGQFNSLETLCLRSIRLDKEELPSILSSCPNLLSLSLLHCRLCAQLCISGPCRLMFLRVIHCCRRLRLIEIKAINLVTFDFVTCSDTRYELSSVPKLEKLYVDVDGRGTVPYMFGEVAKHCPCLKSLTFKTKTDKGPYLPTMNLSSTLVQLDLLISADSQVNLLYITPILGGCLLLEKLDVATQSKSQSEESGGVWPTMCHTHLKEVDFWGHHGTRNLIEFTAYLLKSSPALEQLTIQPFCRVYKGYGEFGKASIKGEINELEREAIYRGLQQQAFSPACIAKVHVF